MSEYRKKAEECLHTAEKMRDPAERIAMLGIARDYMALAAHAERNKFNTTQQKRPHQSLTGLGLVPLPK